MPYTVSNIYIYIYINDITNASNLLHLILFADDTNILLCNKNIENLIDIVNTELKKLTDWFIVNRLSLNTEKTKFILFCNSHKCYDSNLVKIILSGHVIEQIQHAKLFVVYIDECLNWDEHIKQVSGIISRNLGALRRLKKIITCKLLQMIYNSLMLPYLTYCNIIWSSASHSRLDKIEILQKKAV